MYTSRAPAKDDCRWGSVKPATNSNFWATKRQSNCDRDSRSTAALFSDGWGALVLWECETRNEKELRSKLQRFLSQLPARRYLQLTAACSRPTIGNTGTNNFGPRLQIIIPNPATLVSNRKKKSARRRSEN